MGFFPTGPVTLIYAMILAVLSVLFMLRGTRSQKIIAVSLIISWVGARWSTAIGHPGPVAVSMTLSAVIAFCGITIISRSIATIYAIRLALLAFVGLGYDLYGFWVMNLLLVYLQLLLAAGTIWTDGKPVMDDPNFDRRSNFALYSPSLWRSLLGRFRGNHQVR